MTDRLTVGQLYPNALPAISPRKPAEHSAAGQTAGAKTFRDMLQEQLVRFSHHAEVRMQQRGIELKPEQLARLQSAIDKAAKKGSKEALILMDNMAMIVNVKNKTIVTAIDGAAMKDNVFTNIDSTVII